MSEARRGFMSSLAESVCAVFLLTLGLLSAASVLGAVAVHQRLTYILTSATTLAEEEVETLRKTKYTDMISETENFGAIPDNLAYQRVVVITPNATDTMKTVEVTVSHLGGQRVKLQTYIGRK